MNAVRLCRVLVLAALYWAASLPLAAAETSEQVWLDINPSWQPGENLEVFGDLGYRFEINNNDWRRLVVRPGVGYQYKKFRFDAGVGNFFTFDDVLADHWELRFFQGVSTTWPEWGRFSVDHYLRLEERFDFDMESWDSLNSLRVRYQLFGTYRLTGPRSERNWALVGIAEGFVKLVGEEGVQQEQVRITAGLQHDFSEKHSLRLELSWQQEGLFFQPGELGNEFIIRVRWFL